MSEFQREWDEICATAGRVLDLCRDNNVPPHPMAFVIAALTAATAAVSLDPDGLDVNISREDWMAMCGDAFTALEVGTKTAVAKRVNA